MSSAPCVWKTIAAAIAGVALAACSSRDPTLALADGAPQVVDAPGETAPSPVPALGASPSAPATPRLMTPQATFPRHQSPVVTAPLAITAPLDGASWAVGSLHWIAWMGLASDALIEVSFDGGATWAPASTEPATPYEPNTSARHLWRVPPVAPRPAQFRVADESGTARSTDVTIAIIPSQARAYEWHDQVDDAGYAPRDGAALVDLGGNLMLLGGWNRGAFDLATTNEIWTSADGVSWSAAPSAPWEERHTFGNAMLGNTLFVLGGDTQQAHYQPDVWSTTDGVAWQQVTDAAPWGNRALHYSVAHAGALWVLGGQTFPEWTGSADAVTYFNDVWRSEDGALWNQVLANAPWPPRGAICGQADFNGEIWVLGGGTYDTIDVPTRTLYSDAWSSADGIAWKRHADPPWFPREYHDVAVFDGRLWVLAGYTFSDDTNHADVWYSADGENWYELEDTPWETRHAGAVTTTSAGLWITTGDTNSTAVWLLTPAPN
jgi:hypothetical protein